MARKKSRTETLIRNHFNLPANAELMYNNKGFQKDSQGNHLRGWFLNYQGEFRYLGRSFVSALALTQIQDALMVPKNH